MTRENRAIPAIPTTAGNTGGHMASEQEVTWPLTRTLAWVVLVVMALALAYTGWIAIANFNQIGV
jgi:hypothetical protein